MGRITNVLITSSFLLVGFYVPFVRQHVIAIGVPKLGGTVYSGADAVLLRGGADSVFAIVTNRRFTAFYILTLLTPAAPSNIIL
jgi:hypothetical protein